MQDPEIINELRRLMQQKGGVLLPEQVVEAARDPDSPLHDQFDWDDDEAARKWRIHQARCLLKVCVTLIDTGDGETIRVRAFTSLHEDRYGGGGYKDTVALLNDPRGRKALLETALGELEAFQRKYQHLTELAEIWTALRRTKRKMLLTA